MKIIADSNILFVEDAFRGFGDLKLYKTRIEDKNILQDADVLLCRSTMKINEELLRHSGIKFVATATSGTEHFDTEFMDRNGIKYVDAKGSNSNSVAEYIIAAILEIAVNRGIELKDKTLGIVGFGCVGKKVEKKAKAIGLNVLINDPPLEAAGEKGDFCPFSDILKCDIITLHVPLIMDGEYKTFELFNEDTFSEMKKGSIFINASRGKVVKEDALINAIREGVVSKTVLDVWYNEPGINFELLNMVDIATPHIAGHSYDGKALGTKMIKDEFCNFFGFENDRSYLNSIPYVGNSELILQRSADKIESIYRIIKSVYNISDENISFRKIEQADDKKSFFERYRRDYRIRREFQNYSIVSEDNEIIDILLKLGFKYGG